MEKWELEYLKDTYPDFTSYLPNLTEREQFVVGERLKGLLLREIAEKMSVTGERVRQIEAKARRKLYKMCQQGVNH